MLAEIERFIDWVRLRSPQAKTWRDYKSDLGLLVRLLGDRGPKEVIPRDLDEFVNSQIERGYKPSTINRRLAAVVSFYRYLIAEGKAASCPVLAKRHYLREPQRLPRPVNEQELRKFFGVIKDVRDRAMFNLMLCGGLRIGEVSALKMTDLFLGESISHMIVHGKGSRERVMYLSVAAETCLQSWLEQRPSTPDPHVFVSYQHKRLSTTSITTRINRVCLISGVHLTAHRLRHTFADHLLSSGMPITSIQKLMGHRFVETTQNYAVANDNEVQADFYQACEKLEGWKFLLETVQEVDPGIPGQIEQDPQLDARDEFIPVTVRVPERIGQLPADLASQLERYRQHKANRWRPERVAANSVLFYSQHLILWEFFCQRCGVQNVSELKREHVQQFIQARLEAGRSARTVNSSLSALRSFLSFLKEDAHSIDPSLERIQRLKEGERLPRYITTAQIHRLQDAVEDLVLGAEGQQQRYDALLVRAIFYLLWQGGLRSGEVELLRFSDFYVSGATKVKRLFVRDGKWRKGRVVYLTDVSLQALKAYLAVRGAEKAGNFVFVRNGLPLRKNFLLQRLKSIGKQAGVSVSPHRLRHTFATQLLNVGCRVTSIQKLLGHTSLNTTMTYARAFDQTVMLDFFRSVDAMEAQPDGAWFALNEIANSDGETKNQASEQS